MELTQNILNTILANTQFHAVSCKCCGRPILPKVELLPDGTLHFVMIVFELRGGSGNQIQVSPACESCAKKFRLFRGTNTKSE